MVFNSYRDFLDKEIVRLRAADTSLGVVTFVMDNGESKSEAIDNLMRSYNILQRYTTYNTPEYNAIIERFWRTLNEMATALLLSSGLPDTFWEDAMVWALFVYNRILPTRKPTSENEPWVTPQEAFYKNGPPSLKHLKKFGAKVIAFITKELRGLKGLNERGTECILVGMHEQMINAYICYKPSTKTYFTTNHIIVISTGVDNVAAESRKTVFGDGIQSSNCRNLGVESLQNESETADSYSKTPYEY